MDLFSSVKDRYSRRISDLNNNQNPLVSNKIIEENEVVSTELSRKERIRSMENQLKADLESKYDKIIEDCPSTTKVRNFIKYLSDVINTIKNEKTKSIIFD